VTAIEDQQPVETLGTHSADEALCDRVCLRLSHRHLHDPDAFAAEHLVEGAAVFAVAATNQERDALQTPPARDRSESESAARCAKSPTESSTSKETDDRTSRRA
jgi:hypothetical protein